MSNDMQYGHYMVQPGYMALSNEASILSTVCGNSVAVIVWDPIRMRGGMVNCIYPKPHCLEKPTAYHTSLAVGLLIKRLQRGYRFPVRGVMEGHILGGAHLRGHCRARAMAAVKTARKILHTHRVKIMSEDVGGESGRKIMFNVASGDLLVAKTKNVRHMDWMPELALQETHNGAG